MNSTKIFKARTEWGECTLSENAQNYVSLAVEDIGRAPTDTTDKTSNTDKESTNNNNSNTDKCTMNSNTNEITEENNQEMLDSLKKETILLKTQILELRKERSYYPLVGFT